MSFRLPMHFKCYNRCQSFLCAIKSLTMLHSGGDRGTRDWTTPGQRVTIRFSMSALFFKRFLKRPFQIASIVPSSKALVERVADKIDFDRARVIAEYGPGEGVHSREIARRMRRDCRLLLF